MKRAWLAVAITLLAMSCFSSIAFAWGPATHAYIDDRLNRRWGPNNLNEMYGGMAPDLFNYMFDSPYQRELTTATHCRSTRVWDAAILVSSKALAYGFVSHNNDWAADFKAHYYVCPDGTPPTQGYIAEKGLELKLALYAREDYQFLHAALVEKLGPEAAELLENELIQDLVETGVDLLVKRSDPWIGQKILYSAMLRSPAFPLLLAKAYAPEFAAYFGGYAPAVQAIVSAERMFRQTMVLYGQALTQDEATAIQLISEQLAELAKGLLTSKGISLPPDFDLIPLIRFAIEKSRDICAPTYLSQIESTITFVDGNLKGHGISY